MASQSSTTTYPARAYSQANPIDLTLEDDDDDIRLTERMSKRPCTSSRSFNASCSAAATPSSSAYSRQSSSGLSPAMSHSSLAPHAAPNAPSTIYAPQPPQSSPYYRDRYELPSPNELRAARFQGPSTSSAFFQPSPQPGLSVNPLDHSSHSSSNGSSQSNEVTRHVIDLTSSPSPPPQSHLPPPQQQSHFSPPPQIQPAPPNVGNLPMDLPPKTPVCIGVIAATALVLYPIPYLTPQDYGAQDCDWAPVRLHYEPMANKPSGSSETINIRPPSIKGRNGEVIPGETFAVVEQRAATYLGPMLGKGLIRLDAKIRRGSRTVSTQFNQVSL